MSRRRTAGALAPVIAVVLGVLFAPVATGQSGTFCSILTAEEVAAAISAAPTEVSGTDTSCEWAPDAPVDIFKLGAAYRVASIDVSGDRASSGTDLGCGGQRRVLLGLSDAALGRPARRWFPGALGQCFATGLGDEAGGDRVDAHRPRGDRPAEACRSVAADAPSPPTAAPSVAADPVLEAMFPAEIAGEAVTVRSASGDGLVAQMDPDQVTRSIGCSSPWAGP